MREVNVTDLRSHLPAYLGEVQSGEELLVTSRGKVIARIVPARDEQAAARERLVELRSRCLVGDVVSPLEEPWEVQR
ncbi:type II toxin-antitoxin system prevent-host-death family antitoxin [Geobacter sp.]|uniref:type II toxin-antitoxin system Phd/YefM family antitoxin n=1 Tax=Geobacter sp. TaxID=46610 RepID=UPI00262587B1|nr:type II toxin-antitoxin system prevent-host-death family antitoxin [Geobacter sp.]